MGFKKTLASLLVAGACVFGAKGVSAYDFNRPDWREQPLGVYAEWTFDSDPGNKEFISSDRLIKYGDGVHEFNSYASEADIWFNLEHFEWEDLGSPGGNDGGRMHNKTNETHRIQISLNNWLDDYPVCDIRVQFHYSPSESPVTVCYTDGYFYDFSDPEHPKLIDSIDGKKIDEGVWGGMGHFRWEDWRWNPNPDNESIWVEVPAGAYIDQIVVDTRSYVPEPEALPLLTTAAIAGACAGLYSMRKKRIK